jgi:hypothetical protein
MKSRAKVDWTKCFKLVEDMKQFDSLPSHLETDDDNNSHLDSEASSSQTDLSDQ